MMGSNASALHASYAVAPSVTTPVSEPAVSTAQHLQEAMLAIQKAQVIAAGGGDPDDPFGMPVVDLDPEDIVGTYEAFCTTTADAQQHLAALAGTELEVSGDSAVLHDELAITSQNYLNALSVDDLQLIAAANGFQHPELAGSELYGQHPLVHWLNPVADPDLASKAKVQAKALERYEAQLATGTFQGSAPATPSAEGTEETWQATPAQMIAATSEAISLAKNYQALVAHNEESPEALAELIAAEKKVATAHCAELDAPKMQAAVRGQVDQALAGGLLPGWNEMAKAEHEAGKFTLDEAHMLSPTQTIALLRASTPAEQRTELKATADLRGTQMEALWVAHDTLTKLKNSPTGGLALPAQADQLQDFLDTASTYAAARAAVLSWKDQVPGWAPMTLHSTEALLDEPVQAWVKQQKLPQLRNAASEVGMDDADAASRAAIKDWIATTWTQPGQPGKLPDTKTIPPATPAPPPPPAHGKVGGFIAKHRDLVSALQQAKATAADLPVRHDPMVVAGWTFGPGKTANLGGMHTKTVHTAPDGSAWMFKPDKTNHGARAHAEAAASAAFHAAGVASVPVYVTKVGAKTGSIQPLISNAHPLPDSPADWSQADVDAIVRFHVASWVVGDHDGKADNVLRTPSGGLVPIDQGQAFKFYGSDNLAINYHPNKSFGAERPVFQQAYEAHLTGKLGHGVTINPAVAHPVIKAFEAIPDTQWRALLHDTAHQGAQHGVAWVPAMRKRAATTLGIPEGQVSPEQIADAFLDHATQRKHGLRAAFVTFFTDQVHLDSGAQLLDGA